MSDPVAAKSTFLCMYMSNHPDTLVLYAKYYGGVTVNIESASMASIDSNGMTLKYKTKGGEKDTEVRVRFDPPLSGYEEVKPRLLNMKADAEESLGMTPAPQISTFSLPPNYIYGLLLLLFIVLTTFGPSSTPFGALRDAIGMKVLRVLWIFFGASHVLLSLYTAYLCKRHRTGYLIGGAYVGLTVISGFPVYADFRKRVQTARIDSIMKGK